MNTPAYRCESSDISIIEAHHFASLGKSELYELLGHYGVVLLRNCIHNPEDFSSYVRQNSSRLSLDPARIMVGGAAQLVDAGRQEIGLHCENGNSPFWPDITWFYCQEAPRKGSQTTLCDGEKVLAKLSSVCRTFFEQNPIRYSRAVTGEKWRRLVCHYSSTLSDTAAVNINDLMLIVGNDPQTVITFNPDDDSIHYAFSTSAILVSQFSQRPAFANSILGPSFNYEVPVIDTVSGQPIPAEFLAEIATVSAQYTYPVGWRDHDMVMIDNRRVMHGREAIVDERRRIFNALSYR
ncbi:TauD/TfdA family dioxygenase [Pseudomonas cannabina]|uniref:Taurine catabolism dioxygenase TauD n=1 Tax=Pseudomonas syringae pv. maculicola str. ES4326 TaxID=629265 RepID=A0A8T8C5C7_PSEYM|nr:MULTISPECIES: TauD/TfdA family dioxygenase [Pseudomonas syringae group]KPB72985.1 Taurine catabolism dioxygenase TauD/TfdA [Pseudomonas syringae pv. maculicola]QHE98810.1 taurine catabolism dioxygenase TauD [Pseudomonas syringae pv. maculicola str. ES4326]QQN21072.1 TauD/TfdA family dioxygenase [Pseudomonas cannabina pv. alisalensis]UBY99472.1 TauD/TfdA family dioxygenase [Pseudomonas cannabina pv. alisalensis]